MSRREIEIPYPTGLLGVGAGGVLELVLEATNTGLWTWDLPTDLVRWSPETYSILGLQPGTFDGSRAAFFALVHPDDLARVHDAVLAAVRDRRAYSEQFRIVRPDGSLRWVTNRGSVFYDAHGAPESVVGTITDVTDRHVLPTDAHRMDDSQFVALLSEQRFRNLADAAPALLWATDERHECTFLSRGWLEFTAQSEEQGRGMGWTDAVHVDDRDRAAAVFLDAASRYEPFSLDYRLRRADGEYRWAIDTGRPRFGLRGEFLGYIGSVIDVHERKLAEDELRHQAAIIDGISKGTQDLIAAQDGEFRYVYFNDAYRRTFESLWGKELRVGTSMDDALADWPEELDKARSLWGRAHAGETFSVTMEFGPGAAKRTFDLRFNPVLDATGRRIGAAHILRDVTEQVRTQQALRDSEATLRAAAGALQDADRRKDLFLATLSHELRNPLAPIRAAAQILLDPRLDRYRLAAVQTVIQRQVAHMACLLDDLMDVSRITNGKLKLKRERMRLGIATDAAIEATQPLLERKQHRLVVSLPAEPIELHADPVRVAQILSNLLTNAAKYTDRGGRIELAARREGADAVIEVRDDGIGIAPEVLPTVFEMFAQADDSHARTEGGLGIGLALVKGLVELHGGSVHASSDGTGQGSRFLVRLPCAADARIILGAPDQDSRVGPSPRRRVLIADDNRDGTDTLAMVLELAGHDVQVAYDGRSALALAAAFRPELAILDIGMPEMDGYALARALRSTAAAAGLVLVAVTGWGQQDDRRLALEAGFDHHLTKPVDVARLESLLARVPAPGTGLGHTAH